VEFCFCQKEAGSGDLSNTGEAIPQTRLNKGKRKRKSREMKEREGEKVQ